MQADDRGDERVAELVADPLRVDRPDTGDLATLARERITTEEYLMVDDDMDVGLGP